MREHEGSQHATAHGNDAAPRQARGDRSSRRITAVWRANEYAVAFERVRLVRAWIAAAAALVAVVSGCVAVIERMMR
jgi:hypothetical protein